MKKKIKFIGASILFIIILTISSIAVDNGGNGEVESSKGGNGEVLHHSFAEGKEKVKKAFEKIYGKKDFIVRIINKALKAVGARDGDSYAPTKDVNISIQDERFVIHANISRAKRPISCNIPTAIIVQDDNFVTLDIEVKDIGDKVMLYNQDNQLLLEYYVIRELK